MSKPMIYFLCTGNSCRSQMAEGWGQKYLDDWQYEVHSAGIEAHGINSKAVEVMKEVGVDISDQESTTIDLEYLKVANYVTTLCGVLKSIVQRRLPMFNENIGVLRIQQMPRDRKKNSGKFFGVSVTGKKNEFNNLPE